LILLESTRERAGEKKRRTYKDVTMQSEEGGISSSNINLSAAKRRTGKHMWYEDEAR